MATKVHIIGICGTFMGGLAKLAKELGLHVQGSDQNTYPPMSTQLESLGITLYEGYKADNVSDDVDIVIVGNTISRGNPELEYVLKQGIQYTSGAQWLAENILHSRWVLAIAGTHGKTTTTSILAWILEYCDYQPGFLIGGVAENFNASARLGDSSFFIIEADEYDTAFSDKRSKFIHYRPRTLVVNNLEFDHADIFENIEAIQTQFHHLIKTIPENGQIIFNADQKLINDTLQQGVWSELCGFNIENNSHKETNVNDFQSDSQLRFSIRAINQDGSRFSVFYEDSISKQQQRFEGKWELIGLHNLNNAVAAIAAAHHVGVPIDQACLALAEFKSVKRRLELKGQVNGISVYDDFAHHPTAIRTTIQALKSKIGEERLIAVIEPRSNTMKLGTHKGDITQAITQADQCYFLISNDVQWDTRFLKSDTCFIYHDVNELISELESISRPYDHILMMSNGDFANIHNCLLSALALKKYQSDKQIT